MTFDPAKRFDQLFASPRDVLTDEAMVTEMYYSHIARHRLFVLDQSAGTDLYGDPAAEPVYSTIVEMPIHIKLDPEEEELIKYGYDRTREVVMWFSRKICYNLEIIPKVGDRVDFTFRNPLGGVVNEHFILNEFSSADYQRQLLDYYSFTAAGNRTHKRYQPNPPGSPQAPKVLAFDEDCLKNM